MKLLNLTSKYSKKTIINKQYKLFSEYNNNNNRLYKVTLFKGDGVGPEIAESIINIFKAAKVPIEWEDHTIHSEAVTEEGDLISKESLESVLRNKVALKGPFGTPIGKGHRSLNVTLRKKLKLYANVRPVKTLKGIKTVYDDVDLVTIRENTEGEYSGLEHEVKHTFY
jgi:isocitrate dehydrogenase (NAD+)